MNWHFFNLEEWQDCLVNKKEIKKFHGERLNSSEWISIMRFYCWVGFLSKSWHALEKFFIGCNLRSKTWRKKEFLMKWMSEKSLRSHMDKRIRIFISSPLTFINTCSKCVYSAIVSLILLMCFLHRVSFN